MGRLEGERNTRPMEMVGRPGNFFAGDDRRWEIVLKRLGKSKQRRGEKDFLIVANEKMREI